MYLNLFDFLFFNINIKICIYFILQNYFYINIKLFAVLTNYCCFLSMIICRYFSVHNCTLTRKPFVSILVDMYLLNRGLNKTLFKEFVLISIRHNYSFTIISDTMRNNKPEQMTIWPERREVDTFKTEISDQNVTYGRPTVRHCISVYFYVKIRASHCFLEMFQVYIDWKQEILHPCLPLGIRTGRWLFTVQYSNTHIYLYYVLPYCIV